MPYRKTKPRGYRARNPVPPSSKSLTRQAEKGISLYKRFSGHDLEWWQDVEVPDLPAALVVIGDVDFIGYTTRRDGKKEAYEHKFSKAARPLLCVAPDGSQIILVGGQYIFTERGIVDTDAAGQQIQ